MSYLRTEFFGKIIQKEEDFVIVLCIINNHSVKQINFDEIYFQNLNKGDFVSILRIIETNNNTEKPFNKVKLYIRKAAKDNVEFVSQFKKYESFLNKD